MADKDPVNGNGTSEDDEPTEDFQKLIDYGLPRAAAKKLDDIYKENLLKHSDLDNRALDGLKGMSCEDVIEVLDQFKICPLANVKNKSSYLCGVIKAYKHKFKVEKRGPDEEKLKEILDRTGYSLDVTTGQRKYGGPPPDYDGPQPGNGHEVFCGRLPKDVYEDELVPLFEKCGKIWDLRIMMEPLTCTNKGYCFVTFCDKDGAQKAVDLVNDFEIRKDKKLKCNISIANTRLFVGNIPKNRTKEDIKTEFSKLSEGLLDVIVYGCADDPSKKNRGFAFLDYDCHKNASIAKKKNLVGKRVWQCDIIVDWADPQEEADDEVMSKVKVLYVSNLTSDVKEDTLEEKFAKFGKVERVKKMKDYAFIHFEEREDALAALEALNNTEIGKNTVGVSLAKPQSEAAWKKKEQRRRDHERQRYMAMMSAVPPMRTGFGPPDRPRGRGGPWARPPPPPEYYDYGYDYGYGDYRGGYVDPGFDYDYEFEGGYYQGGYSRGPRMRMPPPKVRGRGGMMPPRVRGGLPAPRGRAGMPARGGPPMRGGRGGRGGGGGMGAMGGAAGDAKPATRGGKRKLGGDHNQGGGKRRNVQDQNWGAQPIAQQPLGQSGYNQYGGNDAQWYQDSYGQNWS